MNETYFVYREPESIAELKSLLLLRYSVYMESRLQHYVEKNKSMGIELDCYDVRARHFGLFKHENGSSRPVGYIRMVLDEEGPWADEIRAIANEVSGLADVVNETPSVAFPLMTYFPDAAIVNQHYQMAKKSGRRTVEAGRLSLERSVRSISVAKFLVSSTVTAAVVTNVKEALLTCVPSHERFYHPYGFEQCAGTTQHFCDEPNTEVCCEHWSIERLQGSVKDSVLRMADAYYNTGRICLSPSNPEQFYAPTQSYIPSRPRLVAAA
jgi:hypothetical protein